VWVLIKFAGGGGRGKWVVVDQREVVRFELEKEI
jgi:hypothetical protein